MRRVYSTMSMIRRASRRCCRIAARATTANRDGVLLLDQLHPPPLPPARLRCRSLIRFGHERNGSRRHAAVTAPQPCQQSAQRRYLPAGLRKAERNVCDALAASQFKPRTTQLR